MHIDRKHRNGWLKPLLLVIGFPLWFPIIVTLCLVYLMSCILMAPLLLLLFVVFPWAVITFLAVMILNWLVPLPFIFMGEGLYIAMMNLGIALIAFALCIWVGRLAVLFVRKFPDIFRQSYTLLFLRMVLILTAFFGRREKS